MKRTVKHTAKHTAMKHTANPKLANSPNAVHCRKASA